MLLLLFILETLSPFLSYKIDSPTHMMANDSATKETTNSQSRQKNHHQQQHIKKQATPSQMRANHEQQQQQQINGKKKGVAKSVESVKSPKDQQQKQLADNQQRVESARVNLDQNLSVYSARAQTIKDQIGAALEQQSKYHSEPQVNAGVEELRNSIAELSTADAAVQQVDCTATSHREPAPTKAEVAVDNVVVECEVMTEELALPPPPPPPPQPPSETTTTSDPTSNCFEPLSARLDPKSKFVALKASLASQFTSAPELLEPICKKFIHLTNQIDTLTLYNEQNQMEIGKLRDIKGKLSELCRELQKTNNEIRIENLSMIKGEQNKAKEQAGKIQSTLGGVMKLFDENQQRNLALKQENLELQNKLKSLLEHCENWEKCVDTTLKQRDIENKLLKTEIARLNLLHNEEKERFCLEKQELLKALSMMRGQQSKIEEKEAKLRLDLSNYASKYDECQEIIHKGLSKFQLESKRMLKQIEKSRQDYIQLLGKYEQSNKTIKKLLEEKQNWAHSLGASNKKLDTLERLCRSLKLENDQLRQQVGKANEIE